jgi:hypothetical protein
VRGWSNDWCDAGGELMEVMDGKCNAGAGEKEYYCSRKMVGVLLKVS